MSEFMGTMSKQAMLEAQGGLCDCCGKPLARRKLHVYEHRHPSGGKVLRVICSRCNLFLEDPERFANLMDYLDRHGDLPEGIKVIWSLAKSGALSWREN